MIVSHSIFLAANRRDQTVRYGREALADNFARSGLVEALGWFRRQQVQPVTQFQPRFDETADPPQMDTIDESVGIVREFPIDGSLWGRYEVRHADVNDVSTMLGMPGAGSVWDVGVRAFVYRRNAPELSYDTEPNRIVLSTAMSTEMRGVAFVLPVVAAINLPDFDDLMMGDQALVDGGGVPAVASKDDGGVPVVDPDISGTPATTRIPNFDASPEAVFSMPMDDLISYADVVIEKREAGTKLTARDQIVALTKDMTEVDGFVIDNGLLVVDGNLTLGPGSETAIRGLLYVNGQLTVGGLMKLDGAMIVNGPIQLNGATDPIHVHYNPTIVQKLSDSLSRYRLPRNFKPTN